MPLMLKPVPEPLNTTRHAVQFVAPQANAPTPVQPVSAIETALINGDVAALRSFLREGADPNQVHEACVRQAQASGVQGQQCAKLIQAAKRINRLLSTLPASAAPAPVATSENASGLKALARLRARFAASKDVAPIERALRDYDLEAANRALQKTRVPFLRYKAKHQDQLTGMIALDSKDRIRLWNNLLLMRSARAKLPDGPLKDAVKATLYYSQKPDRNQLINLNCRVNFSDEDKEKIVCRHLTLYWLKERAFSTDGKVDYRVLGNKKAMKAALIGKAGLDRQYNDIERFSAERHNSTCKDFGVLLGTAFEEMRDASPAKSAKRMLVRTWGHAMGVELKIKKEADGSPAYCVNFYDPNTTTSHHRVRTSELDKIKALALTDLVHPIYSRIRTYQSDALVQLLEIPDKRYFDKPPMGHDEIRQLHKSGEAIPVKDPESFHILLMKEKYVAHVTAAFGQIANEPDIEQQMHLLEAKSRPSGVPGLFQALRRDSPEVVKAYLKGVLKFPGLSSDQKTKLLSSAVEGVPALAEAVVLGAQDMLRREPTKSVPIFMKMVANTSTLSSAQKIRLLSGRDAQGTSILTRLDNDLAETIRYTTRDQQSYSTSYLDLIRSSYSESKRQYVALISAEPGLTRDEKRSLLEPRAPEFSTRLPGA